jgi:hypothetical protein
MDGGLPHTGALDMLAPLALMTLAGGAALGAPLQNEPASSKQGVDTARVDWNHPKLFLRITELDRKNAGHWVLYSDYAPGDVHKRSFYEKTNAAVDINSRMLLEFDRDWLRREGTKVDIALSITAQVKGATEVRNIEVPGYSMVGEGKKTSVARIRSASELLTLISELDALSGVRSAVQTLRAHSDSAAQADLLRIIRLNYVVFDNVLSRLADSAQRGVVVGLGFIAKRDPDVLMERAGAARKVLAIIRDSVAPRAADAPRLQEFLSVIDPLLCLASDLQNEDFKANSMKDLTDFYLRSLKDSDLLVSLTGAKPGEDIVVTFTNNGGDIDKERSFSIRIRVRRFGLVQSVTDGTFLVKRRHIEESLAKGRRDSVVALVRTDGAQRELTLQDRVQFDPAGGTTMGWVFNSRDPILDFFRPGIGVNVSFAKFTETKTVFSAKPDTTVEQTSSRSDRIDILAGLTLSLFDNSVQATYGWALTANKPRSYWGIGFSFIQIAEKIAALQSGGVK